MLVVISSFLHSSLHPSICELHYAIPFLPHYILIVHITSSTGAHTAFFLSASYHNLPFPPSPFNVLIYKSHYTQPLSSSIYASYYTVTHAYCYVHSICTSHYSPIKHAYVTTSLWNVHVALHPSVFASHYIQCFQVWQQANKNRQISILLAFRKLNMFLGCLTSVFLKQVIYLRKICMYLSS
jgi:hypothetical protein